MIASKGYIEFYTNEGYGSDWDFRPENGECGNCKEKRAGVAIGGGEYGCFICWDCLNMIAPEKKKRAGVTIKGEEHSCFICRDCLNTLAPESKK